MNILNAGKNQSRLRILFISFVAGGTMGCVDTTSPSRVSVGGKVTMNGSALSDGLISLIPADANAESVIARIDKGRYEIEKNVGPTPGVYTVIIHSQQLTGRKRKDPDSPSQFIDEVKEIVPPQFNSDSKLTVKIGPDRSQTHDLSLKFDKTSISRKATRRRDLL